jgi:hypothetical protein
VRFPHPNLETSSFLGSVLAAFIFASLMFGFVSQVSGWGRWDGVWRVPGGGVGFGLIALPFASLLLGFVS